MYSSNLIVFNQTKGEEYNIHVNFRQLHKQIRNGWEVETYQFDEITEANLTKCRIFVLPSPRLKFTEDEFSALRKFIQYGGSLFVLSSEGGEENNGTNINFLLEEFGISFNNGKELGLEFSLLEALISNGVINRTLPITAGIFQAQRSSISTFLPNISDKSFSNLHGDTEEDNNFSDSLEFIYPNGCTLNVNRKSISILSTGTVCYPISRPVCAFHYVKTEHGNGRLAVCGSVRMFVDDYFDKEDNSKIFDVILKFLSGSIELNQIDAAEPNITDYQPIPDNLLLSNKLKLCLQENEYDNNYFGDFIKLFDQSLSSISLEDWPEAKRIYERIGLKYEPLTLVIPTFQVPMPPYQPAVFPPQFRELPQPQLELINVTFDLQLRMKFSSRSLQTDVSTENELDMYIREASEILGINKILAEVLTGNDQKITSKRILDYVTRSLLEWKKSTAGMVSLRIMYNFYEEGDDLQLAHTYLPATDGSGIFVETESDWVRQQNSTDAIEEENYDQTLSEIYQD
ncbi:Intraflagellar transport protein 52 [Meloidogyne graminicola]|uniref:Intraflagellar transport protein 52 n=1 Tax=Meloidogyne graminicola TaxID=189291 RepID=A0A8S9ZF71_9BILA|nr:Intraflagellar transport protein 52 [Meloidogyne graminicola]